MNTLTMLKRCLYVLNTLPDTKLDNGWTTRDLADDLSRFIINFNKYGSDQVIPFDGEKTG